LVNGGAFGGKSDRRHTEDLQATARRLADEHGRPVRVVLSREDVVRRGPKRPPMAVGVRADGSGIVWAVRTPGLREAIAGFAPDWEVIEVDSPHANGPATSMSLRAAGWAELAVARCSVNGPVEMPDGRGSGSRGSGSHGSGDRIARHRSVRLGDHVIAPNGAEAWARVEHVDHDHVDHEHVDDDGAHGRRGRERIIVHVRCGPSLDAAVLRSYCIGAAHMALGWVRTEGLAVDERGTPVDLTIRSFGVLRAADTPDIVVEIEEPRGDDQQLVPGTPVNGSDAVFAAVAAAVWRHDGFPPAWPSRR
jgi:hypothetical protein